MRTGEGDWLLKNDRIVPFFLGFCFFFCGTDFEGFMGFTTSAISSSVAGGDDKEESESMMSLWCWVVVSVVLEGARVRCGQWGPK